MREAGGAYGPGWIGALRLAIRSLPIAKDFKERVLARLSAPGCDPVRETR